MCNFLPHFLSFDVCSRIGELTSYYVDTFLDLFDNYNTFSGREIWLSFFSHFRHFNVLKDLRLTCTRYTGIITMATTRKNELSSGWLSIPQYMLCTTTFYPANNYPIDSKVILWIGLTHGITYPCFKQLAPDAQLTVGQHNVVDFAQSGHIMCILGREGVCTREGLSDSVLKRFIV